MAQGHIEFTPSSSMYVCVSVFQIRVQPIASLCMVGFKNHPHKWSSRQDDVSRVRKMWLGQSHSRHLKFLGSKIVSNP